MMKIPYTEIMQAKMSVESNDSTNVFVKICDSILWRYTKRRIYKVLKTSISKSTKIYKNDIIQFAEFVLASSVDTDIRVGRIGDRYSLEFENNTHTYLIDTHGSYNLSFYITDTRLDKSVRMEFETINTDSLLGRIIYSTIIDYIIKYLNDKGEKHDVEKFL